MRQRFIGWGIGFAGLIVLGFSVWLFVAVGLDRASKLAGICSFVIAALGLGTTIFGVVTARRSGPATQAVADSSIAGGVLQVSRARGKVTVRRTANSPAAQPNPGAVPAPGAAQAEPPKGQSVTHSRLGGPLDQIHDVGELDVDR
ncbi:hypothetical protein [Nocardia sp. NPDC052566]|uniref:hypothetical protein n=1 Tax=Nocardia sp. NPDC052566 TaxID=3364330 RepID=UPI0037CB697F